jgi:hypothetical protein
MICRRTDYGVSAFCLSCRVSRLIRLMENIIGSDADLNSSVSALQKR